jgi:hypothetical protein
MTTLIRVPTVVRAATAQAAWAAPTTCSTANVDFAELHNFASEYGEASPVGPGSSNPAFLAIGAQ